MTNLVINHPFVLINDVTSLCLLKTYRHGDDKRNLLCAAFGFSLCSASDLAASSLEETFTEGPQSVSISWINIH